MNEVWELVAGESPIDSARRELEEEIVESVWDRYLQFKANIVEKVRNQEICTKYKNGVLVKKLAEEYSLSVKSIQRIIRTSKQC